MVDGIEQESPTVIIKDLPKVVISQKPTRPPTVRERVFSGEEFKDVIDLDERTNKIFRRKLPQNWINLWGGSFYMDE